MTTPIRRHVSTYREAAKLKKALEVLGGTASILARGTWRDLRDGEPVLLDHGHPVLKVARRTGNVKVKVYDTLDGSNVARWLTKHIVGEHAPHFVIEGDLP